MSEYFLFKPLAPGAPLHRSASKLLICKHFASSRNDIFGFSLGEDIHRLNINPEGERR